MIRIASLIVAVLLIMGLSSADFPTRAALAAKMNGPQPSVAAVQTTGPLRVHPTNPRYFTDGSGKAILLTGSHTWTNLQNAGDGDPPPVFDYNGYLDFLVAKQHNFFRLWRWEQARWGSWNGIDGFRFDPQPYLRPGPGTALDGKPKFDLNQFNQDYFDRMRQRIQEAGERGIYVSVMLFDGWSMESKGGWGYNPWQGHPFNQANNINGINGDPNNDGEGLEIHSLTDPPTLALSEAYVRKVIDTVNDLDNVLYEISNESGPQSIAWQYHLINLIKSYEATKPKQHPVGMTGLWPWPNDNREEANAALYASPADWISPAGDLYYRPLANGDKVIIADTDHLCGICGDRVWAWISFMSGENPLFMDVWDCAAWWYPNDCNRPVWPSLRDNLGYIRTYANRLNLAAMTPRPDLFSTELGLAQPTSPDAEFLAYLPNGGSITVDLRTVVGTFTVEWFDPQTGATLAGSATTGGARQTLTAPFAGDAILYLYQGTSGATPTTTPTRVATNTPTPAPTATATLTPSPTPTPLPPTATPTPLPTATPTSLPPTPTKTTTPLPPPPTSTPTRTPLPTLPPAPLPPTPTKTNPPPPATATHTPTRTPTPPTPLPAATRTPAPTATSMIAGVGSLTGSIRKPTGATVNLSALGTLDWVSWGRKSLTSIDRKVTGGSRISTWTPLGVGPNTRSDAMPINNSWSDGAPTTNAKNRYQLVCQTLGAGFRFTAPADSTWRTLKIYVGVWKARGKLVARLSDNSAPIYSNIEAMDSLGGRYQQIYEYTLVYKAAAAGQSLIIEWSMETNYDSGDISLGAAALVDGVIVAPDQDIAIKTATELDSDRRVNLNLVADPAGMRLNWTVRQASDILGFHLLRSDQADRPSASTISPEIISHTAAEGVPYTYLDATATATTNYTYWLNITYTDGTLGELSPIHQDEAIDSYLYLPLLCGVGQCGE